MSNAQRCKFCHNITWTHEGELFLKDEELLLQLAREPNLDLVPLSKKEKNVPKAILSTPLTMCATVWKHIGVREQTCTAFMRYSW